MLRDGRSGLRRDLWLAAMLIAAGVLIALVSFARLEAGPAQLAQAGDPAQPRPAGSEKPAESKPGGTRPTTPAPEPARPDADAQKTGASPALPPAPPEKVAPPIKDR